jgi:predicted GNAT family acetyltransferase
MITVLDVPDKGRFEARDEEQQFAGMVTYQLTGDIIVFTHTEVDPAFEGKGVGSQLARAVLDDAKAKNRTVVPICPFIKGWIEKHPDYQGLVAPSTRKVK